MSFHLKRYKIDIKYFILILFISKVYRRTEKEMAMSEYLIYTQNIIMFLFAKSYLPCVRITNRLSACLCFYSQPISRVTAGLFTVIVAGKAWVVAWRQWERALNELLRLLQQQQQQQRRRREVINRASRDSFRLAVVSSLLASRSVCLQSSWSVLTRASELTETSLIWFAEPKVRNSNIKEKN